MCGILGVYRPSGLDPAETRRRLEDAALLLAHRGPDASGVSILPEEGVGFAHRRLAILDLDARANQPMLSADGSVLLTFNGEIYNFRALRERLRQEGAAFRTESDSEVLIEGYRLWGMERLLAQLAGMFAFALYDARKKSLFLVRDRAGKKPLFYSERGGAVEFASEIRGLLRLGAIRKELDPSGLDAYLSLKFVPPPGTLFRGISKIPPGCYLEKTARQESRVRRYWNPYASGLGAPASREEALERLDQALAAAVERRMVSDVPVCLFLSGGIDSSLMVSYLSRAGFKDLAAYSIGYEDLPAYNEFEYSRLVAGRFPVRYSELVLRSKDALETLEDEALVLDEPVSDWVWVPLYQLSRRAHADGFKVALVGEGSDEIFFGYDSMMKGLRDMRRFENPLWRLAAKSGSRLLAPVYEWAARGHNRYDLLRRAAAGEPIYMGSSVGWTKSQRRQVAGPRLLSSGDPEAGLAFIRSLYRDFDGYSSGSADAVNAISYVEFRSKMSEVLLQRVDRVTMLHSLEARSPYLDHDLVELAFSIPGEMKIGQGRLKGLLKDLAGRHLPPKIVARKKMGFSFPFKEWLRSGLGEAVDGTFRDAKLFKDGWVNGDFARQLLARHRGGWQDHAPRVWALFDLCRWYDRWIAR